MRINEKKRLGLYIHIPFCRSKCAYCDFFSFTPQNEEIKERYVSALIKHMESYRGAAKAYAPDTVFIGGGTPTALGTDQLVRLIREIKRNFSLTKHVEFTVEANPMTADYRDLAAIRRAGANRLSIGLQSGDNRELMALSRQHNRAEFEQFYRNARRAKFDNISIDVMYGIPFQTVDSFMKTLRYVVALEPEHISMYGLKIEQGTPFFAQKETLPLPNEDAEYEMYMRGVEFLTSKGYEHYEISNFARSGYRCMHNMKYWNCEEYLGLGVSAHSYFNGSRFSFKRNIDVYMNGMEIMNSRIKITDESYEISPRERVGEYVMLRMRLSDGIDVRDFERRFALDFDSIYGRSLQKYIKSGFVSCMDGVYSFTNKGMFVSNYILSEILDFPTEKSGF